jgi:Domain of unknown function (DUF4926)
MTFENLECVVLVHDIAEHGLRAGDVGAVVMVYEPDGLEVEFVTANGGTRALLTLKVDEVRKAGPGDMLAIRHAQPAA